MSRRQKYPSILSDIRLASLQIAELHAEGVGRENIDPGPYVDSKTWLSPQLSAYVRRALQYNVDLGADPRLLAEAGISHCVTEIHRELRWVSSGMPIYRIDHDTVEALRRTNVDSINVRDVRWPTHTFAVFFEPPYSFFLGDTPMRIGWASETHFLGRRAANLIDSGVTVELSVLSKRRTDLSTAGVSVGVPADDDITLGEAMARYVGRPAAPDEPSPAPGEREMMADFARFMVSFALYTTAYKPRPFHVNAPKVVKAAAPWGLPREWVVVQSKIQGRKPPTASGHTRAGVSPRSHVVAGHWRMQSYGPHHSLRRPLWIKPHWRGSIEP